MVNRTICSVLEEMRKTLETRNFSYLLGLIEEAQTLANRMEAGLADKHDVEYMEKRKKELKAEIKILKEEKESIKGKPETSNRFAFDE